MSLDIALNEAWFGGGATVFEANITHNLTKMAAEAGIYEIVWYPEEAGIKKAGKLIEPLEAAIEVMKEDPERFKAFNHENGWGTYDGFVQWLERYLEACKENPKARISAHR